MIAPIESHIRVAFFVDGWEGGDEFAILWRRVFISLRNYYITVYYVTQVVVG